MKDNLRKLNLIIALGIFNPDDYYAIRVGADEIALQGNYNSNLLRKLKLKKMDHFLDDNGYFTFKKNNIRIILTD